MSNDDLERLFRENKKFKDELDDLKSELRGWRMATIILGVVIFWLLLSKIL